MRRAVGSLVGRDDLAEGLGYTLKRKLLGRPLINEQLREQRLSKRLALGVLSPDGISSSAYGTEEILIDYVVTVAVQVAAGTAAVASAFPHSPINKPDVITLISIGVVNLMCYGNL